MLLPNKLEIEVLPTLGGEADDVASDYLRQPEVASILYYRTGKPDSRGVRMLEELCRTEPSSDAATFGSYALGRLYLDAARCAASEGSSSLSQRGLEHLGRSMSRPGLSRHRRRIAHRLLTEASAPVDS